MRYLLLIFLLIMGISNASAATDSIACTMEYAPVCGSIQVQCIRAPCPPIQQTFSNSCMATASHATGITPGACDGSIVIPPVIVGGDSDIHGCKASAGYSWESRVGQCLRPWESRVRIIHIAPEKQSCTAIAPLQCLRARFGFYREWQSFYSTVAGFDFLAGYAYRLLVLETILPNTPADAPSFGYTLIRILSQIPITPTNNTNLLGTWKLQSYQQDDMMFVGHDLPLTFTSTGYNAKICNSINGSYTARDGIIASPMGVSTMMYCEGQLMTLENAFRLDGARYLIEPNDLGTALPTMRLTLTTKQGGIFRYLK